MLIDGPLKIGVLDQPEMPGRELHFTFTPEFQALDLQAQVAQFQAYLQTLQQEIHSLKDDDQNRAGMLIVQQIAEQLVPHLQGEIWSLTRPSWWRWDATNPASL